MERSHAPPETTNWTLSDQQVLTALQNAAKIPLPGSPLRELASRIPLQPAPPPTGKPFGSAWKRLLRPDYILKIRAYPSLDPTQSTRHYAFAGDTRFVRYRQATSGSHHIEWPHTTESLLAACDNVLGAAAPAAAAVEALALDQDGYAALLAAGDCIHEEMLQSALERREVKPVLLTAASLQHCFKRAAGGIGLLWLSGRGAQFAPERLSPPLDALQRGLEALTAQDLLVADKEGFIPTQPFTIFSRQLSGDASFVSLTQLRRTTDDAGQIAWQKSFLTVMRTHGPFWLFAFDQLAGGGFTARITAATRTMVGEKLLLALTPPPARPAGGEAPPPTMIAASPPPLELEEAPPAAVDEPPPEASPWHVVSIRGEWRGARFEIADQLRIGREADCTLRLTGDTVSRHHAVLKLRNRGVMVRDLKSTNGTFVNGVRIEGDVMVQPGDTVDVGETRLRVNGPPPPSNAVSLGAPVPPPPAYVPPLRPGDLPDPAARDPAPAFPPPPAPKPVQRGAQPATRRHSLAIPLIIVAVALCAGLVLLAALFATGILPLPF